MSDFTLISSVSQASSTHTDIPADASSFRPTDGRSSTPDNDTRELSLAARYLRRLHALPAVRAGLVLSVRSQIVAGTYSTDPKLDAAVDGILSELEEV